MKFTLTEDELKALDDGQKALYSKLDDGTIQLKVEGLPDYKAQESRIAAMDAKMNELLTETKTAKKLKKEAEEKLLEDRDKAIQQSGDVDAINKSWEAKYNKTREELQTERDSALKLLKNETIKRESQALASRLAAKGCEAGLMPHISPRISVELVDGQSKVVILDADGKPSAATMEELENEIKSNTAIAPLLSAGNASGSGAGITKPSAIKGLGRTKEERIAAIKSRLG